MSDFRIKTYQVGQMGTNCYVIYREDLKKAIIVDPGDDGAYILKQCEALLVKPEAILLTHGHFDHIMGVAEIKQAYPEIKIYAGEKERKMLSDPSVNMSFHMGRSCFVEADHFMSDGETLEAAGITLNVIATPGHTEGSVCYYKKEDDVLISGDTLFLESLGRTDLPGGNPTQIIASIREKLFTLPGDTMVYPGHGNVTTIGHEKSYNPVASYRG